MKIFVAYSYDKRDKWIEELVFPIIQAFGDEVVTGKELYGEDIRSAVTTKIAQSQGLIGFMTKREANNPDSDKTHRWVTDEFATASAHGVPAIEVREKGVDDQEGIGMGHQYIEFDEQSRDKCLVELVKAIGLWHKTRSTRILKLMPVDCVQEISTLYKSNHFKCTYKILFDNIEFPETPTNVVPIMGGLFVTANNIPSKALIQLNIEHNGNRWSSSYENTDYLSVHLTKEPN